MKKALSFILSLTLLLTVLPATRAASGEDAGVLINNGAMYGTGGEGFIRLNVGCPRSLVDEALSRLVR